MNLFTLLLSTLAIAGLLDARAVSAEEDNNTSHFSTLITLGDSYTDNCNAQRIGWSPELQVQYPFPRCPPTSKSASGGVQWPTYFANQTGMNVLNLAHSGAVCNNTLFPRYLTTYDERRVPNPDVAAQIEIVNQVLKGSYGNAKPFDINRAIAAIYIGTNDLTFLVGKYQSPLSPDILPFPGESLNDEAGCVASRVVQLYDLGVRNFVILNNIPLQSTALFSYDTVPAYGGYTIHQPGKIISAWMEQLVLANNGLQAVKLANLEKDLSGSKIKVFDTFNLYNNIINDPSANGFGPNADVKGYCQTCDDGTPSKCKPCADPDHYVFFDQLHPGEKAGQILATALQEFIAEW